MLIELLDKLAKIHYPLRPPGAIEESDFLKTCIGCRKCMEVCPFDSIKMTHLQNSSSPGTPYIMARDMPCYLCMECPEVCPTEALKPGVEKEKVTMGIAVLDESLCFAYNGILCRACYERCPIYREAIILKDELFPKVIEDKCVGCGICENVCLTEPTSISIISRYHLKEGTE